MSGGFFRGTSVDQDARFSNKATALLQSMHFPSLYRRRVELSRVDVDALSGWVHSAVTELLSTSHRCPLHSGAWLLSVP